MVFRQAMPECLNVLIRAERDNVKYGSCQCHSIERKETLYLHCDLDKHSLHLYLAETKCSFLFEKFFCFIMLNMRVKPKNWSGDFQMFYCSQSCVRSPYCHGSDTILRVQDSIVSSFLVRANSQIFRTVRLWLWQSDIRLSGQAKLKLTSYINLLLLTMSTTVNTGCKLDSVQTSWRFISSVWWVC